MRHLALPPPPLPRLLEVRCWRRAGPCSHAKSSANTATGVLGWNVNDLDTVLDRLARAGVNGKHHGFPFQDARGVASFPGGARVCWLEDPDGNIVSVAQMPKA